MTQGGTQGGAMIPAPQQPQPGALQKKGIMAAILCAAAGAAVGIVATRLWLKSQKRRE